MTVAFDVTLKRKQELDQILKREKKNHITKYVMKKVFFFFFFLTEIEDIFFFSSAVKKKKLEKRTFDRVIRKIAPKLLVINNEGDQARR